MKYWFYYSSEEFSAAIYKVLDGSMPSDWDRDYSGHYVGPFRTLKEARDAALEKVRSDEREFKMMRANIASAPETIRLRRE